MASYSVILQPEALTELLAAPFPFRRQINQRIYALKQNPRPANSVVVTGELRIVPVHGWLLVYEIDDDRRLFTVFGVLLQQ